MKKLLYPASFLFFFIVSFIGGARFNQHGAHQGPTNAKDRQILHYIDPMNPTHTAKEPGIAPCGMPMEPVYADEDAVSALLLSTTPGTVKINRQKQQIIGVQIDEVTKATETYKVRALGRIVPDENRVYAMIAGTDGWMGEIHESTTGSLVSKNQLMAKIRVYNYDFFTWQQRYLTELGNSGRRRVFVSPLSGAADRLKKVMPAERQTGPPFPDTGVPQMAKHTAPQLAASPSTEPTQQPPTGSSLPRASFPSGIPPGATEYGTPSQKSAQPEPPPPSQHSAKMLTNLSPNTAIPMPADPIATSEPSKKPGSEAPNLPSPQGEATTAGAPVPELPQNDNPSLPVDMPGMEMPPLPQNSMPSLETAQDTTGHETEMKQNVPGNHAPKPAPDHSKHLENKAENKSGELGFIREDDILYASKARQELLDLGVGESQLAQLAKTGVYVTYLELRSPVDGLVVSRAVSPRQRINRGAECFRIADLSKVWIEADLYDVEAKHLKPGMLARVSLPKQDAHFSAKVSEVLPRFDATTRTLKVRLVMDNTEKAFRPDMFVDVEFLLNLPESINVPSGAVIDSGKNKTVYVAKTEGLFEPRAVVTGWRFNDRVEILEGLKPGEKIVSSGNFLIDSESRMKLSAAKLMDGKAKNATENQATTPSMTSGLQTALPAVKDHDHGKTVKDPICEMTVDPDKAKKDGLTIEAHGKTYYFCSLECAEEFRRHGLQGGGAINANPKPHASPGDETQKTGTKFTSPVASHTLQEKSFKDPICGMTVSPDTAREDGLTVEAQGKTYYFCSMECVEEFRRHGLPGGEAINANPQPGASPDHAGHHHD